MLTYFAHHTLEHTISQESMIVFAILFIIVAAVTVRASRDKDKGDS